MSDNMIQDMQRYGVDLTKDLASLFASFLEIIGNKAELIGGKVELDELQNYARKGGILEQITFDKEHLAAMEKALRDENVLFSIIGVKDSDKVVCLFKEEDSYKVNKAKERFNATLGIGINELKPDRFLEIFKEEQVGVIKNVDVVTLELMRNHLQKEDCSFTVVKKGEGFDIIYPTSQELPIQRAMKRAAWDLSSPMANEIKNEIKQKISERDKITSLLNDVKLGKPIKDIMLVDAKNPNRFIEITKDGFVVHNLSTKNETIPDEVARRLRPALVIEDIKTEQVLRTDKNFEKAFFRAISSMNDSVVAIKPSEYTLFDKSKEFIEVDDTYKRMQKEFNERIRQVDKIYPKGYTVCSPVEEQIKYVKNLSDTEEFELYQALRGVEKEAYVLKGKELAYKESYAEIIEPIIKKVTGESEELEILRDLRLKGYDIDKEKDLIIIDKDNPSKAPIRIENKSKTFVLNSENTWNEALNSSIGGKVSEFSHPIVVTVDEYQEISNAAPADRMVILDAKVSEIEHSFAGDSLKSNEETIKRAFERDTFYEQGKLNDENLKRNERLYGNKHLKAAIVIASSFAVEVIEGKQITRKMEDVAIEKGKPVNRSKISR